METIFPRKAPAGAILVIHSWWGLTDSFREFGSSLAGAGYLVSLADLFGGQVAKTDTEAREFRAKPRRTPIYKTLGANIAALRTKAGSNTVGLGVVGSSMGGHWAVWLSQRPEYNVEAAVLYYAARAGDFSNCGAGFIAHFAEHDPWVSVSARRRMERAIHKSCCDYKAFEYQATQHWFAESNRPNEFDESAAKLALKRDLLHFEKQIRR